jgi:head-tail adaptor
MQTGQVAAMQDTCVVQSYSRTLDTYGSPVESFTDGAAITCGVNMTPGRENRRTDLNAAPIDATIRLPIATSIKSTDHVKVTHRFGVAVTNIIYEVIGEVRRGPSGLQVDCQVIVP